MDGKRPEAVGCGARDARSEDDGEEDAEDDGLVMGITVGSYRGG